MLGTLSIFVKKVKTQYDRKTLNGPWVHTSASVVTSDNSMHSLTSENLGCNVA